LTFAAAAQGLAGAALMGWVAGLMQRLGGRNG
jgi:hypothetical protein